ncbi:MAG TPA: hypothetical protein VE153_03480 [Myxococcus sp.]|jgi:hypothetical protein|nr:hypothetical protein [Myxococcus sp.]
MKAVLPMVVLLAGCAASQPYSAIPDTVAARGPWPEVPAIEMPTEDASIPIGLLRDAADALLKLPGAKVCEPMSQRPIAGLSVEYCSTLYVAGTPDSLSWRLTEPVRGSHKSCTPFFAIQDEDHPASQVWVVGYIHNHPCAAAPSSADLGAWPTDAFDPYVAMAEVRLIPGNPAPSVYRNTSVEMASALVAERQDGTRVFLRYFPTGEVQQWSEVRARWVSLGTCAPRGNNRRDRTLQCSPGPLRLLHE